MEYYAAALFKQMDRDIKIIHNSFVRMISINKYEFESPIPT